MEDYEKEGGGQEKWLYKERRYAHIQMQSGVPEIQAYIEFGKRTELHQYIKFMQLLTQYIRRGSRGMEGLMLIVGDCADDCNGTCIFVYVG